MAAPAQTAGIDLPLRALVWEAPSGAVWLSYDEPALIAERHGAPPALAAPLGALLRALAAEAARDAG